MTSKFRVYVHEIRHGSVLVEADNLQAALHQVWFADKDLIEWTEEDFEVDCAYPETELR